MHYNKANYLSKKNRENVGLLGSTRVGSRRVIQISAGFMIFFSMLGESQNIPSHQIEMGSK
jgi:hypothetical protein